MSQLDPPAGYKSTGITGEIPTLRPGGQAWRADRIVTQSNWTKNMGDER
jgi:hypothetical protein